MEFHISRRARARYQFDQTLFGQSGNVIFANFHAARVFAEKVNRERGADRHPELAVTASQINAMGMIDEILHYMAGLYRRQVNSGAFESALEHIEAAMGRNELDRTLRAFTRQFPPREVYQQGISPAAYLKGKCGERSCRATALEELVMLWLANENPAFSPYLEFFDDTQLTKQTAYHRVLAELHGFFETLPAFGPDQQTLIDLLRSPAVAVPHSLTGQLEYIRARWGNLLGSYLVKLLGSLNFISEEQRAFDLAGGAGPVTIPVYTNAEDLGDENYSPDQDWMPRLVLMAKNAYVWLDQLSKQYGRHFSRLDQIPDEELERLASWGMTGLWLIGVWERSPASARIKQLCGNPDAIASAYSLAGYRIADELGGEEALQNLRQRARRKGIRLASDMVPNHMGIDSSWVHDHPEWFIHLDYSPFPSYSFNGVDLSNDGRGSINLEDHYYTRTDAAVVFKYYQRRSGKDYFIYHGNDGTSMPWNDTAQLNYLNPEVREAVIQTILDVAKRFPVIRFDAAMTLAKRHYQRLWYPEPGSGASIASRSDFGLTREQFNEAMPREFWREVVERVAQEAPDTLLLAEAFWLMEGYFVRTLGMHRVYNSAFMNLLRDEDNDKYRQLIKNTLEFDPEILKRYVNFMNNPDERTAVDQFGKSDKYFGICLLMATMPGLPMFGHGQVQGLTEKYGMEYRRAYYDEQPDEDLISRHEREIFPMVRKRALFAGVERFLMYDFFTESGTVDENVFAYSNALEDERALVVYHNRYAETGGWIRISAAARDRQQDTLVQYSLAEGLGIIGSANQFVLFRDALNGLEYIRPARDFAEKGLFVRLGAYQAHLFTQFDLETDDEAGSLDKLCATLNGIGSNDLQRQRTELVFQAVLEPFRQIAHPGYLAYLIAAHTTQETKKNQVEALGKLNHLLDGADFLNRKPVDRKALIELFEKQWLAAYKSVQIERGMIGISRGRLSAMLLAPFLATLLTALPKQQQLFQILFEEIRTACEQMGMMRDAAEKCALCSQLIAEAPASTWKKTPLQLLEQAAAQDNVQRLMGMHKYKAVTWIVKEGLEEWLWSLRAAVDLLSAASPSKIRMKMHNSMVKLTELLTFSAEVNGYDFKKWLKYLKEDED